MTRLPVTTATTLLFLMSLKHSCKHLHIPPIELATLFKTVEEARFAAGDYYNCPPPAPIWGSANYSLTGPQQSLTTSMSPTQGNSPFPAFYPGTSIPTPASPHLSTTLTDYSPFTMATQPRAIPTPMDKATKIYPELAFKPMGPVGNCPIPRAKLEQLHPAFNPDINPNHTLQPYSLPPVPEYNKDLETLITSMMPDIIKPVCEADLMIPLYHGTAFAIPKPSSNKLSLIINLAAWNHSQHYLPPKFSLPSVYSMRAKLFQLHLQGKDTIFFTKWDVSNFYWSLKADLGFRIPLPRADGTVTICQLDCLPFGWDKSPWIGQSIHEDLVHSIPNHSTDTAVYIDDGLAADDQKDHLQAFTNQVLTTLQDAGFIISPKSEPEPTKTKEFIGKLYTATTIANTKARVANLLLTCCDWVIANY